MLTRISFSSQEPTAYTAYSKYFLFSFLLFVIFCITIAVLDMKNRAETQTDQHLEQNGVIG